MADCRDAFSGSWTIYRPPLYRHPFYRLPLSHLDICPSKTLPRLYIFSSKTLLRLNTLPSGTLYSPGHYAVRDTLPSGTLYRPGHFTVQDTLSAKTVHCETLSYREKYLVSSWSLRVPIHEHYTHYYLRVRRHQTIHPSHFI